MIPIPIFGGQSLGLTVLTLVAAVIPALVAWWNDRRLLSKADDPALPELLANRRRLNVRSIGIAIALMIFTGITGAAWGIPLLVVLLIAASYPLRTHLLGETWGFGAYLWHTALSIAGGFGFWIALAYAPGIAHAIVDLVGTTRWWLIAVLSLAVVAILVAWEHWYPRIWLWAHASEPLASAELTPRFDEIVQRAGTVSPQTYRVGPKGSRFVNAVALPSVRQPAVAMGNALIELLEPDETAAIFAHEVAHFDHYTPRRIRRAQLLNRALIVTGVALPLIAAWARIGWAQWIGWLWPIVVLVALGRRAAKSQQHETESDLRAAALCGDPEALVRGLVKLHLHARIPRRYDVDIERAASHPSLVRRIQAIREGGAAAIEQLGTATVVPSTREGSWVVLDDTRAYWLDGVPAGTDAQLASLRDAASSYRAVNYKDLVELRVAAAGDARTLTARARGGDAWSVPIATDDVARVQRTLDVVDLRLGKAGPAPARATPAMIAIFAFAVAVIAGQAGVVLAPILIALSKPSASALAALGAMSIMRAILGIVEGTSWFDEDIVRLGLAAMAVIGVIAIYTAIRLVRAGEATKHLRLTMSVIVVVAALVGGSVVWQAVRMPSAPFVGSSLVSAFGTALSGIAAALFVVRTRWSRPAAYVGLATAALFATLGVDRTALSLRNVLTEVSATATAVSATELSSAAQGLRVSPNGTHFLATRSPMGYRPTARARLSLLTGRIGGPVRDIAAIAGEFVDDDRVLVVDALEQGVELRLERVDSAAAPLWADTLADVSVTDPRLILDRDAGSWAVVATDEDNDRTAVLAGKIGGKGVTRRTAIPDTLAILGEPIVFGEATTLIVPAFSNAFREGQAMSLWSLPFTGFDAMRTQLYRVRGDTLERVASLRGAPQCGEPLGGAAACAARHMKATSLYSVNASGAAQEVAQLPSQDLGVVAVGPGLRAASMTFSRAIIVIDLAARRLTRIPLPPNSQYASEVRAGAGYVVTLSYAENRRSTVRLYRVDEVR